MPIGSPRQANGRTQASQNDYWSAALSSADRSAHWSDARIANCRLVSHRQPQILRTAQRPAMAKCSAIVIAVCVSHLKCVCVVRSSFSLVRFCSTESATSDRGDLFSTWKALAVCTATGVLQWLSVLRGALKLNRNLMENSIGNSIGNSIEDRYAFSLPKPGLGESGREQTEQYTDGLKLRFTLSSKTGSSLQSGLSRKPSFS